VGDEHWPEYYAVTVGRPAWRTVVRAVELFEAEGPSWRRADQEPRAIESLRAATPPEDLPRLETLVADLAEADIPPADLVNASISLPFIIGPAFDATVDRAIASVRPGGRFATMLFGDRDESASDPEMSCRSADWLRDRLTGFAIEDWFEREEDGQTALGEPHHWHILEVVACRVGTDGRADEGSIE
jgi:tellurite methyltransferase